MEIKKAINDLRKKDWRYHKRNIELSNHMSTFKREFRKNVATLFVTSLGLVGALFWQRAIDAYITYALPGDANNWLYRFYAAVIMTFIAVVGTIFISRFSKD